MHTAKREAAAELMPLRALKGALIASVMSIALVLLYALVLKLGWLDVSSMAIVTPAIKVLGAAAASFIAVRRCIKLRWLCGGLAGFIYILLAFMVFSILSDTFTLGLALLSDAGMGVLCGIVTAMLYAMFK